MQEVSSTVWLVSIATSNLSYRLKNAHTVKFNGWKAIAAGKYYDVSEENEPRCMQSWCV
jgi:hypothetical protein